MDFIEIMGPSGIGKSTLLKSVLSKRESSANWVVLNEALLEIANSTFKKGLLENLFRFYLKQNIIEAKKNSLVNLFLDKKLAYLSKGLKYEDLMQHYINQHLNHVESTAIEKAYRISLFKGIIENLSFLDSNSYSKLLVLDEGPFNHLPNLTDQNQKFSNLPIGFIFCDLDENTNFNRIKEREEHLGRVTPIHRGLTDEELKKDISKRKASFLKKKDILISYGKPFLEINLGHNSSQSIVQTKNFLDTCSKN